MKTVSAADANRHFSKILREVQAGATITVTSRGKPVATIRPADDEDSARNAAWRDLRTRLAAQPAQDIPIDWTRDDLYDDEIAT
jgi:prevent-host-death family protein